MMSSGEQRLFNGSLHYQLNMSSLHETGALQTNGVYSSSKSNSFSRSSSSSSTCSNTSSTTCLRKIPFEPNPSPPTATGGGGLSSDESLQDDANSVDDVEGEMLTVDQKRMRRMQANKRERKRMHTVNSAFDDLRELVPTYPSNRKLSKIETLRLACAYIEDLAKLLRESTGPAVVHGEDVNLHHHHHGNMHHPRPGGEGFTGSTYSPIKNEYSRLQQQDYNTCNFQHYRVPLSYDYESCPSDPEIQSPPTFRSSGQATVSFMSGGGGLAVKPPALARVSSDTAVSLQMAQTSLNTSSSGYCGSPVVTPCSPLTRVQHSTPAAAASIISRNTVPSSHHYSSPSSSYYNNTQSNGYSQCYSQ